MVFLININLKWHMKTPWGKHILQLEYVFFVKHSKSSHSDKGVLWHWISHAQNKTKQKTGCVTLTISLYPIAIFECLCEWYTRHGSKIFVLLKIFRPVFLLLENMPEENTLGHQWVPEIMKARPVFLFDRLWLNLQNLHFKREQHKIISKIEYNKAGTHEKPSNLFSRY